MIFNRLIHFEDFKYLSAFIFCIIITMSSLQFSPKKPSLLEPTRMAFLKYVSDHKQPLHNYQQRSIYWDREHLYNQNLLLRNKLKQMAQVNTKAKTQLRHSEKQMIDLESRKESSQTFRSLTKSNINKRPVSLMLKLKGQVLNQQGHEKHELVMKKELRRLKEHVQTLQAENLKMKKSMKYTRMNELQAQNKQLNEQILRLVKIAADANRQTEELFRVYLKQKQEIQQKLRKDLQARVQAHRELKRVKEDLEQARSRITNGRPEKKLISRISFLEQENTQLKNILDVNMKNNSELKENLQSYVKNNQFEKQKSKTQLAKLDYSVSAVSEYPNNNHSTKNSPTKMGYTNDLTSLQFLSSKASFQDFKSPQKLTNLKVQQKIAQVPHIEEQQDTRPLNTLQRSQKAVNLEEEVYEVQKQVSVKLKDYQSQFEDIMEEI